MDYRRAIKKLYPNAVAGVDYILQDDSDGQGVKVKKWKLGGEAPTKAELEAYKVEVETEELEERQIENKIEKEIRLMAIANLISKGDIPVGTK